MLHRELISKLVKNLTKSSFNEKYLYEKLIQYKLACAKNNFDFNVDLTKYFNSYELKEIFDNYKFNQNTFEFNKWFSKIFNISIEKKEKHKWQTYFIVTLIILFFTIFIGCMFLFSEWIIIFIGIFTTFFFMIMEWLNE